MYNIKYVFAQLVAFLDRSKFNRILSTFSTKLNFKISMTDMTLMGQTYLIFNQLPFLWDTSGITYGKTMLRYFRYDTCP